MDLRQRVQKRNEKLTKMFLAAMSVIMITLLLGFAYQNKSDEAVRVEASQAITTNSPKENYTIDESAQHVCLTTDYLNVRSEASTSSEIKGTLDVGTSVTVLPSNDSNWYYVKEFKGYVSKDFVKPVSESDVIGVATVEKNGEYFTAPEDGTAVSVSKGNTYVVRPFLYNGKFLEIGDSAYIDRALVTVDYYDRDFYEHVIKDRTSRGFTVREARSVMRKNVSMNISEPSGLSLVEINKMTRGTSLDGIGPALKEIEENNGVNAIFALSVAMLESGNGESYLARNQNNIFGLDPYNGGMSFSNKSDCVRYFGRLIQKHYFGNGRDSLADINQVYEPYNSNWSVMVQDLMYQNRSKAGR